MILLDANVLIYADHMHLAAFAIEHGYAVASTDNDFRRFAGLKCISPLG